MQTYLRTVVRTARTFDGVTPETTTGYSTDPRGGNWLRTYKTSSVVGAFTTRDLGAVDQDRPIALWFRLVGVPNASTSKVNIRSAFAGDTDPDYLPNNRLLSSHAATNEFTGPIIVGPTDRVCPVHAELTDSTFEFMSIDYTQAAELGLVKPLADATPTDDCCITSSITVTASTTLAPWNNTLIVFLNAPAGTSVYLPAMSGVALGRTVKFARIGGGVVYVGPTLGIGDTINGKVDESFEVDGFKFVTVERRETTYISDEPLLGNSGLPNEGLENVVPDAIVACPTANAPVFGVRLSFTAPGSVRLPSNGVSATGDEIYFERFAGDSLVTFIPQGGETLDGVINAKAYMPRIGVVRFRKVFGGWSGASDEGVVNSAVQTVAAGDVTIAPWAGHLIIRLTEAAAQNCTMPDLTKLPVGATARIVAIGGAKTVLPTGTNRFTGKAATAAASVVLAAGVCGDFQASFTDEWTVN